MLENKFSVIVSQLLNPSGLSNILFGRLSVVAAVLIAVKSGNDLAVILCKGGEIWQNFVSLSKIGEVWRRR